MHKQLQMWKSVNNGGTAGIYRIPALRRSSAGSKTMRVVEETEIIEEIMKRLGQSQNTVSYGLEGV